MVIVPCAESKIITVWHSSLFINYSEQIDYIWIAKRLVNILEYIFENTNGKLGLQVYYAFNLEIKEKYRNY